PSAHRVLFLSMIVNLAENRTMVTSLEKGGKIWPCYAQMLAPRLEICKSLKEKIGASEGIRTLDIHLGKVTLYQTELRSLPKQRAHITGTGQKCKRRLLRDLSMFSPGLFTLSRGLRLNPQQSNWRG